MISHPELPQIEIYNSQVIPINLQKDKTIMIVSSRFKAIKKSLIIGLLFIALCINILFVFESKDELNDFGSFIASGQLANENKNPYSIDSPLVYSLKFGENGPAGYAPNLNPPISVVLFQGLAKIDPTMAIMLWRIVSVILYFALLAILHKAYPINGFNGFSRLIFALCLAGFWHTLQLGQLYVFLLVLCTITWLFLKKKSFIAGGIFLGLLIAIKPNFLIWAVLLFAARNWRAILSAALSAVLMSVIPLLTHGITIYKQWIEAVNLYSENLLLFPGNNSFQGLTARFGFPETGEILSILLLIFVLFVVVKYKPGIENINGLGILTSLLISPIAWTGYTLLALPVFFEKVNWKWEFKTGAAIYSTPFIIPLHLFTQSFTFFVIFGWFYGWGSIVLFLGFIRSIFSRTEKIPTITSSIQTN